MAMDELSGAGHSFLVGVALIVRFADFVRQTMM